MKKLTLALVVQNCVAGEFEINLNSTIDFVSRAAVDKADIIIFPEMNLTGYTAGKKIRQIARPLSDQITEKFSSLAGNLGITILTGLAEQVSGDEDRIYASHLVFHPGKPVEIYRKIHTAPNEKPYFSAGHEARIFSGRQLKFGIQLCYDAHFPELSTAMAEQEADVIFLPHASPRGSSREKYESWMRHLSARAFDNGIFIAAVNQTGDNGTGLNFPGLALVLGPDGNIVSRSLDNKEQIHRVELDPEILEHVRSHRMRYFLPNRRRDLFPL
ncbi:nitrilase-related carbon-nitrogen hydrolase [Desulfospira joergensenii]|uniref:nitrilase-related carbon-nitrogen hydrolase n=1 Tax=Desulfospira joergensenii TaxID=53329 RepID=UPI0003B524D1|nr:nitrilase-related carbon-nitrogen hydrolase [Desulfospira joergensenii]